MNFLRISIEFQSLQLEITKRSLKHYSNESWAMQITPRVFLNFNPRSLAGKQEQSRAGGAISGEQGRRRWGARGGKERGAHGLPLEGLGARGRGRRGRLDGAERPAVNSRGDGGAPAAVGGGEQV
jgi:hypothetical protein